MLNLRTRLRNAIIERIAATKSRLLAWRRCCRKVEWGTVVPVVLPDLPDPRGRKSLYAYFTTLHAFIEDSAPRWTVGR